MTKKPHPETIYLDLDDRFIPVEVCITERERVTFAESFGHSGDALGDAASIFDLLCDLVGNASTAPPGHYSLLKVCGLHFGAMREKQSEHLFTMVQRLKDASDQAAIVRKEGLK